ncbi:hypothetical protein TNCV_4829011 [Trichonephila clavipes]|nr:hypothetical protein TNCV_4829011 [Trichonephila clavipes]
MAASSSSFIPTSPAHADNHGEGHPRGTPLHALYSFFGVTVLILRSYLNTIKSNLSNQNNPNLRGLWSNVDQSTAIKELENFALAS